MRLFSIFFNTFWFRISTALNIFAGWPFIFPMFFFNLSLFIWSEWCLLIHTFTWLNPFKTALDFITTYLFSAHLFLLRTNLILILFKTFFWFSYLTFITFAMWLFFISMSFFFFILIFLSLFKMFLIINDFTLTNSFKTTLHFRKFHHIILNLFIQGLCNLILLLV